MPYLVVERPKGQFHVFKQGADGKAEGTAKNKHPYASKKEAMPLLRALYAAERDNKEPVAEFDLTLLSPSGAGWDPIYPQDVVGYIPLSPSPVERCGNCVFFQADGFCALVASYPLPINADGLCDKWTALSVLADPAGVVEIEDTMPETSEALPIEAIVEAPTRAALEDFVISEFKAGYPDVPDAPGIDKVELVKGDPTPTFVIRPIAQVGRRSKNGVLYDQALVNSIREQINANRPGGIFGHIKPEDRATAHPQPQAYWIGAKQYGDKLWAKAYIADMERAKDIRRKKSLGSADGTSIYGTGEPVDLPDGARRLNNFVLESLDFAPLDRASLDMGKEMYITSEMTGDTTAETAAQADNNLLVGAVNVDPDGDESERSSDDNDILEPSEDNEMASDVLDPKVGLMANWKTMLPDAICEEIAQMVGDEEKMGKVAEAHLAKRKMKAVAMEMQVVPAAVISEMEQTKITVAELQADIHNYRRREFEAELSKAIAAATPNPHAIVPAIGKKACGEANRNHLIRSVI